MKCPECGATIPRRAKECPQCGFLPPRPYAPKVFEEEGGGAQGDEEDMENAGEDDAQ